MIRRSARVLLLGLIAATTACADPPAPVTPTVPTTIEEPAWTGTLTINGGGTVIYNPSTSEDIMTEVLKSTVNIPPTVVKRNGDRIQVLVARDLDFRSVYELKPATLRH